MRRKPAGVRVAGVEVYFLPVATRMPLKFGAETTTHVTCARVKLTVRDHAGKLASGWGETPLSVPWVWPGPLSYDERHEALKSFCLDLGRAWAGYRVWGHPMKLGYKFQENQLSGLFSKRALKAKHHERALPWLAALVCCSPFDIALHDAYGQLHQRPIYQLYEPPFMDRDLAYFFRSDGPSKRMFKGKYPAEFLEKNPRRQLRAWHLIGGLDPIDDSECTGAEPKDGYPVLLGDWIERDGLSCLKVKLRGNDAAWDYERLLRVGRVAVSKGVEWLSADFNCTVHDPAYVNTMLDRLRDEQPRLYGMILYVEQPFPYDLPHYRIDVHSVAARKPLFLDESAHDWRMVKLGRQLGWTGVALKTCKTQTGAILSACWARAHGMALMVQDLTNPMLAQIPHALLASHVGTIMGVETNAMQFYPEASSVEAGLHPGLFRRVRGQIDLSSLEGPGFGYGPAPMKRALPEPALRLEP